MFCDIELAAKIELAETQLVVDACASVGRRIPDVFMARVGGGLAAFTEPDSPLNKVVGLGFAPFDETAFEAIEHAHGERGVAMQVEISTLADPAIARYLTKRGYELVGVENVSGRKLPIAGPQRDAADIRVARSTFEEFETWADVLVTGFATPDDQGVPSHGSYERSLLDRVIRDFASADRVVNYLATRAGDPVGAASMRIFGGVAQLCGASTLPGHRRKGVQTSLLEARIVEAGNDGCTIAVMTTLPGSTSQANAHKQGFTLLYSRNIFRREP